MAFDGTPDSIIVIAVGREFADDNSRINFPFIIWIWTRYVVSISNAQLDMA